MTTGGDTQAAALHLAEHYLEVNRPEEALDALSSASVPMDDPAAWLIRGSALFALERHEEAREVANAGLAQDPDNISLLHLLSMVDEARGDLAGAERAILAALELAPDVPAFYAQYADLLMAGGQIDKAGAAIERGAQLDPEDLSVLRARMSYAYVRGKSREGEEWSRKLLELEPEHPGAQGMLGVFKVEQGAYYGAREHFENAVMLNPQNPDAREAAIEIRTATHWSLVPLRFFDKLGVAGAWIAAIATIAILRPINEGAAAIVAVSYFLLCVYSWVAPPIVRRLVQRKLP